MKAETGEWVAKAEGDFADAQRGVRVRQARQAFAISRRLRTALRESLGLNNGKGA